MRAASFAALTLTVFGSYDVVFAPHVETSTGIVLPDEYIRAVSAEVHAAGGTGIIGSGQSTFTIALLHNRMLARLLLSALETPH
jgi:hypothetical protein